MWNYKAEDPFMKMVGEILNGTSTTTTTVDRRIERATETDKVVKLEIKMPGHTKDRIKVSYSKGILTVKAESKDSFFEDVDLSYKASKNLDMDGLTTKLCVGVLTIEIPFKESETPKEYKVK